MSRAVVWAEPARCDVEDILGYLDREWNDEVIDRFFETLENAVDLIAENPSIFPLINHELGIRKERAQFYLLS